MELRMAERQIIPAASGVGLRLRRTFDYGGKIYISKGDVLWSDRSQPMLTVLADEVGRHDFLYAACSLEMYRIQYGVTGYHANCHDNLTSALRELGMTPEPLPTPFNLFMNVDVAADGRLVFSPPKSRAGDSILLRAEMDLAIAVSSCPASTCNGGAPARPLAFEILAAGTIPAAP
jgi:uncharacterized protein YcgI (DUF1989 family)